jgi:hypothetical protein
MLYTHRVFQLYQYINGYWFNCFYISSYPCPCLNCHSNTVFKIVYYYKNTEEIDLKNVNKIATQTHFSILWLTYFLF